MSARSRLRARALLGAIVVCCVALRTGVFNVADFAITLASAPIVMAFWKERAR